MAATPAEAGGEQIKAVTRAKPALAITVCFMASMSSQGYPLLSRYQESVSRSRRTGLIAAVIGVVLISL
jgi:hypothetical protein